MGQTKKKKWSTKGKTKDKVASKCILDSAVYEGMVAAVPGYKLVTIATVSERLKVNGSVARQGIKRLESEGKIKRVINHHACYIYTKI